MEDTAHTKMCKECNAHFLCGPLSDRNLCWFSSITSELDLNIKDCMCKPCFITLFNKQVDQFTKGMERDFTRHQISESVEGIDFYIESGRYVFTKLYHLKRGYCCGSGCRHCPY